MTQSLNLSERFDYWAHGIRRDTCFTAMKENIVGINKASCILQAKSIWTNLCHFCDLKNRCISQGAAILSIITAPNVPPRLYILGITLAGKTFRVATNSKVLVHENMCIFSNAVLTSEATLCCKLSSACRGLLYNNNGINARMTQWQH